MTTYPGSFSGVIKTLPNEDVDYTGSQCVYISVVQSAQVLASTVIYDINNIDESQFNLEFNYANVNDPCQLVFELRGDETYNKDFPIEISKLEVDKLYLVPFLNYLGQVTVNDTVIDSGNVLWCTGKLVYNFLVPVSQMLIVNQ
jgi:hypothetical protein